MITERTLKRWRKEALEDMKHKPTSQEMFSVKSTFLIELNKRILRMTQELLDLHLIKR